MPQLRPLDAAPAERADDVVPLRVAGVILSAVVEHADADRLRAVALLLGTFVLGMVVVTLVLSWRAEKTVSGGHPRVKLYRHVFGISFAHGILVVVTLVFIRERLGLPLTIATPLGVISFVLTIFALYEMLSYQNSRMQRRHRAQQVVGALTVVDGSKTVCITPVGSWEQVNLADWIGNLEDGTVARVSVEMIEEVP